MRKIKPQILERKRNKINQGEQKLRKVNFFLKWKMWNVQTYLFIFFAQIPLSPHRKRFEILAAIA